MKVELIEYPTDSDWIEVKRRALVTEGRGLKTPPSEEWKHRILAARHSPIRRLWFSFYMEIPYWVSTHLARHIHAQPYIQSQRNDRQSEYDRNNAPQNATVKMIYDVNAEELMVLANKRLCNKASPETTQVVRAMCIEALRVCPSLTGLLVPMCKWQGNVCHEMYPCGKVLGVTSERKPEAVG